MGYGRGDLEAIDNDAELKYALECRPENSQAPDTSISDAFGICSFTDRYYPKRSALYPLPNSARGLEVRFRTLQR